MDNKAAQMATAQEDQAKASADQAAQADLVDLVVAKAIHHHPDHKVFI